MIDASLRKENKNNEFFWVTFGFFGLIAVPCILMFITCGVDKKHKIGGALACVAFWFIIAGALSFQEKGNEERWNNGYCPCGTHWELAAVDKTRNGTETKYYSCPDCYKEIEIIH